MIEIKIIIQDHGGPSSAEIFTRREHPTAAEVRAGKFFLGGLDALLKTFLTMLGSGELIEGNVTNEIRQEAINRWKTKLGGP